VDILVSAVPLPFWKREFEREDSRARLTKGTEAETSEWALYEF
jgi:hypothetical protein